MTRRAIVERHDDRLGYGYSYVVRWDDGETSPPMIDERLLPEVVL